ncbi:protein-tyrosine phosphatase family protein [Zooshikella harenae]|uniref:Dual specificity protein phosphatase family protein n=1 Tax=Zooshikella harenae TaxID=2827238 RepID=A0ABS5ZL69_9GAMM|nr:dual specificity protein phosphatase family protein [Zooshikella harenae]MBU2714105.1 dual specificity protein phosphatase family protein [Zooshikella harenae]
MFPRVFEVLNKETSFLAVMGRPTGGDCLEDDISYLARNEVSVIVSLLENSEIQELVLDHEPNYCQKYNIDFIRLAIPDRGLPSLVEPVKDLSTQLYKYLCEGKSVVIHCRAGIGRSGLLAAATLLHTGMTATEAFNLVSTARNVKVPDTVEQEEWLINNQSKIQN